MTRPRPYDNLPDHVKANLSDMKKRTLKITEIIDEELGGKKECTKRNVKRINRKIAKMKKHFTEYHW
tara:strand:+ start:740 stop:940 length:201 start_codon:yes stop_codon:yes gene_type:complete